MLPIPPANIARLLARPVAIFGAGVSGLGVRELLARIGAVGQVYDERATDAGHDFTPDHAARHGLVVFSPGFAPNHAWLEIARAAGCRCVGELDFASLFWTGELLAITGTNGKTTLTEFLAHALSLAGRPAHVAGNVGYPLSRCVAEQTGRIQVAVCEVSSFQAETLEFLRPTAVLWTNFAEDHLERHAGMDDYFAAKWRLVERASSDDVFAGTSVQRQAARVGRLLPPGAAVATEGVAPDAALAGTVFAGYPQYENFLLAAAWWRHAGLQMDKLYAAARTFELGAHRLAAIRTLNGVTWWNDSKATNFHAVEAALATFRRPVLWIGGGRAKGGDLGGFVRRLAGRVGHAFLIGETAAALASHCRQAGIPATVCPSLEAAVAAAAKHASAGDHVLLSPAFASFDMFRGYDDRGRQFIQLVEKL
ncbi:MAG TPA: UDP-N-acetylmuramoyl-L-alanine--D-glutamate ligase [Lacunisphaera sp.]|nr:UDP-N-acetylmuramoyl-L-alanine--D-glutamate ligase [Lacunisphaera sp.]